VEKKITVDIKSLESGIVPRYRIYIDNELLTERDFIWPSSEIYIRENIIVDLPQGKHQLKVVEVNGRVTTENITVDGINASNEFTVA
jgi:hypothetical protein